MRPPLRRRPGQEPGHAACSRIGAIQTPGGGTLGEFFIRQPDAVDDAPLTQPRAGAHCRSPEAAQWLRALVERDGYDRYARAA